MTDATSPRLSPEIRLEMLSSGDRFLPKITEILGSLGSPEGEAIDWSRTLQKYLAEGNAMIVSARAGRSLIGFMVLDPARASAPCSWVSNRFRDKGLGQRFYSFACINLAVPTPEFIFHKEMFDEYRFVVKEADLKPVLKDPFYVIHERPVAQDAA